MKQITLITICILPLFVIGAWYYTRPTKEHTKIVSQGDIHLWTESFGLPIHPAILLIHGTTSISTFWPEQFCKNLAQDGYFVIRYDQRDCGYSTHFEQTFPYSVGPYTIQDLAQDAWTILDAYNIEKAHIIGHSLGGYLTEFMATQKPERILSAVMISTGVTLDPLKILELGLSIMPLKTAGILLSKGLRGIYEKNPALLLDVIRYLHGSYPMNEHLAKQYVTELIGRNGNKLTIDWNQLGTFKTYPESFIKDLKKIKTPCLFIHGTQDWLVPFDHGKKAASLIANAEFFALEQAGHGFFNETLWNLIENKTLEFFKKKRDGFIHLS